MNKQSHDPSSDTTFLIVEDDVTVGKSFAHLLKAEGYRAITTESAEAGLRAIERTSHAALLLDLHLPLMDGLELLRRLRASQHHSRVPVAIMTGDYFVDEAVASE